MPNFDSWSAEHIQNCIDYSKRLLSGLNEWYNMLGRHIMEPQETQDDRVAFVKFLRGTEKKLEEINRDLYRADQNFVTAVESGSKPSYAYESKKLSVKESETVSDKTVKRSMSERIDRKISPQLVSIKNLAKAIYNLQKNERDRAYLSAYGIESLEATHDFMEDYIEVNIHYEDGDTVDLYIYNDASGKGTGKPLYRMTSKFDEIESGNGVQLVTIKDIFRYANIV